MVQSKPSILNSNTGKVKVTLQASPRVIQVPQRLLVEIARAISNVRGWGSVEIFIQDHKVTQITERNINKTNTQLTIED